MKIQELSIADLCALIDYSSLYYKNDINYFHDLLEICRQELSQRMNLILPYDKKYLQKYLQKNDRTDSD